MHVLAKPIGSVCDIACDYCFHLEKPELYPEPAVVYGNAQQPVAGYCIFNDVPAPWPPGFAEFRLTPPPGYRKLDKGRHEKNDRRDDDDGKA
jgi:hypothetical protein